MDWLTVFSWVLVIPSLAFFFTEICATLLGWTSTSRYAGKYEVTTGPHKGRSGVIVSTPWIGNGYHWEVTLNVPLLKTEVRQTYLRERGFCTRNWQQIEYDIDNGYGPRTFVKAKWSQIRRISD